MKYQPVVGGSIDILNSSVLFILFFFNISNQIIGQKDLIQRLPYTLPFIVLALIILFAKSKKLTSAIYLAIGFFICLDPVNYSDFSGAIFFIFAFHLIRNKNYGVFIIIMTIVSVTSRLILFDETIPRTLGMIAVYAYIYAIYYFLILRNMPKPIKKKLKQLTKDQNKLLELMCSGYPQESAGKELGHKRKQDTSKMMKDIREALEVDDSESNYKVIALYLQYGK